MRFHLIPSDTITLIACGTLALKDWWDFVMHVLEVWLKWALFGQITSSVTFVRIIIHSTSSSVTQGQVHIWLHVTQEMTQKERCRFDYMCHSGDLTRTITDLITCVTQEMTHKDKYRSDYMCHSGDDSQKDKYRFDNMLHSGDASQGQVQIW